MNELPSEYKRTFADELDWSLLEQLHHVVLQISTFSFRTKQICVTVDIAAMGLVATFAGDRLDVSIFVAGLAIPVAFWILDSIAYYYQVKLRGIMDGTREKLRKRNTPQVSIESVIAAERVVAGQTKVIRNSFFNHSMWLYAFLIVADLGLWVAYGLGTIG